MKYSVFVSGLLLSVVSLSPAFAASDPDCGNPPVKTAEAVFTIQTPERAAVNRVAVEAPASAPAPGPAKQTSPIDAAPGQIETVQVAQAPDQLAKTPAAAYTAVLQRRIKRGPGGLNLFDYAGAKAAGELKTIRAYTDYLAAQNPDQMPQNDQLAYWANLYNALTVKLILENYPVKSIRQVKAGTFSTGPWKRDEVTVNGQVLSLNDIEHDIMRKRYPNPAMVHYMVNCASIGCPNLLPKLWSGATLEADREAAARAFINSPRGVKINDGELKASSIYNWFKEDFGGSKSNTLSHFRQFAGPELRAAIDSGAKISGFGYDWDLNE